MRLGDIFAGGTLVDIVMGTCRARLEALSPGRIAVPFGQDTLLVAARGELAITPDTLLARLLSARLRLGLAVSTDAGGPAEMFFSRAECVQPGCAAALRAKPDRLRGTGDPPGQLIGARRIMEQLGSGEVDAVMGTLSGLRTLSSVADLISPPSELAVDITSYFVRLNVDPARERAVNLYIALLQSPLGQAILSRHGFGPARLTG